LVAANNQGYYSIEQKFNVKYQPNKLEDKFQHLLTDIQHFSNIEFHVNWATH